MKSWSSHRHPMQLRKRGRLQMWQRPTKPKIFTVWLFTERWQVLVCMNGSPKNCTGHNLYHQIWQILAQDLSPGSWLVSTLCTFYLGQHLRSLLQPAAFFHIRDFPYTAHLPVTLLPTRSSKTRTPSHRSGLSLDALCSKELPLTIQSASWLIFFPLFTVIWNDFVCMHL